MAVDMDQSQRDETKTPRSESPAEGHNGGRRNYLRFGAMIATSTVVMFALTYTNSYALDHV